MARSIAFTPSLSNFLWAEAISHANYLINITPTRANLGLIPYQFLHDNKPQLSHLRIFDNLCLIHQNHSLKKLDFQSLIDAFLGFNGQTKDFRVYLPDLHRIVVSTNVKLDEIQFFFSLKCLKSPLHLRRIVSHLTLLNHCPPPLHPPLFPTPNLFHSPSLSSLPLHPLSPSSQLSPIDTFPASHSFPSDSFPLIFESIATASLLLTLAISQTLPRPRSIQPPAILVRLSPPIQLSIS